MRQNGTWWLLCQLLRQVRPFSYFLAFLGTSFSFMGFYPVHRINKYVLYIAAYRKPGPTCATMSSTTASLGAGAQPFHHQPKQSHVLIKCPVSGAFIATAARGPRHRFLYFASWDLTSLPSPSGSDSGATHPAGGFKDSGRYAVQRSSHMSSGPAKIIAILALQSGSTQDSSVRKQQSGLST